jgi:hypothetical protein
VLVRGGREHGPLSNFLTGMPPFSLSAWSRQTFSLPRLSTKFGVSTGCRVPAFKAAGEVLGSPQNSPGGSLTYEMYDIVVPQFSQLLAAMKGYFVKAAQHADARKFDVNTLLSARLAPDQYDLAKQVTSTCFLAEECLSRLAGRATPVRNEPVKTVADVNARIDKAVDYVKSFTKADFQGWEERPCDIFFAEGKYLPGSEYLVRLGVPNVFFHLMTVYSILRHNGVDVGKLDYLGPVNFRDKK